MKKAFLAAAFAAVAAPAWAQTGPDVIYGKDDRLDLYQVKSEAVLRLADSTVGLFSSGDVTFDAASGVAKLKTDSYSETYRLCPEEPFFNQRTGAFCSGSLVGPDLVMTAGHCVRSESACTGTKFVFGFGIKEEGKLPESVAAADVYGCAKLVGRVEVGDGADWALVKLDRPVAGHAPLGISRAEVPAKGTKLFVIGHPAGLPTKVAGGAAVRDPDKKGYFIANLDTYGGNSGSAVFNEGTGLIEGILVRGEQDYVWRGNCRVSKVCTDEGCSGEHVTKVGELASQIPAPIEGRMSVSSRARVVRPTAELTALLKSLEEGAPFRQ